MRFPDELVKARRRLLAQRGQYGSARASAMAWVLKFARTKLEPPDDPETLGRGGMLDLYEELTRFSYDAGLEGDPHLLPNMLAPTYRFFAAGTREVDVLTRVQGQMRTLLNNYVAGHGVEIQSLSGSLELGKSFVVGDPPTPRVRLHINKMDQAVRYYAMHLLAEWGPRIKRCGHCEHLFLASRRDKAFCSGSCQATRYKKDHTGRPRKGARRATRKKGK
jgi:hypothetical protein